MTLIACEGVTRAYAAGGAFRRTAARPVLRGVDLTIGAGECVALIGESGSGKSTLARLVLGLERPDGGTVRFRGRPLDTLQGAERRTWRRAVQAVFQDSLSSVDPRFSVGRIVEEPLRHLTDLDAAARRARVADLLGLVAIGAEQMAKLPGQMSGGQLQRVAIARALASAPDLVVLDEAVSNLDLTLQIQTLDLLADLRRRLGTAYLFITHDLRLARRFADRIAVLSEGRVVEVVAATAPLDHPAARALAAAVLPPRPRRRTDQAPSASVGGARSTSVR
jgi:nickel transport system ATP-binding protein